MSEIRVDTIKAEDGISAPSFPSGVSVTGVITATSLQQSVSGEFTAGSLKVGNNIQVGNAGIVTATTFHGSGANLTGITQSFTNTAIFQYSHNSQFRSYSGEVSLSGNNNVQLQFNMVFDAGDILAASGSNYFSVNATGFYAVSYTHLRAHET